MYNVIDDKDFKLYIEINNELVFLHTVVNKLSHNDVKYYEEIFKEILFDLHQRGFNEVFSIIPNDSKIKKFNELFQLKEMHRENDMILMMRSTY